MKKSVTPVPSPIVGDCRNEVVNWTTNENGRINMNRSGQQNQLEQNRITESTETEQIRTTESTGTEQDNRINWNRTEQQNQREQNRINWNQMRVHRLVSIVSEK
ncbi:hypothetical protein CDAR_237121 [Caerostris darwini]|uniref:Uncharacterized protein n=1 Tax=Caerostris darwini TaxID=1538125 RepID=A0AAV4VZQ1_9ARAC|nr:hypothetical protein CDAR_237121 [Caerostris darwini]